MLQNPLVLFGLLAVLLIAATVMMKIEMRNRVAPAKAPKLPAKKSPTPPRAMLDLRLVTISPGTFEMGSPLHEPGRDPGEIETLHEVTLTHPFKMGIVPVTRSQFACFVNATGYRTTADRGGRSIHWSAAGHKNTPGVTWRDAEDQTDSHPVTRISWEDANAFCQWAGELRGTVIRLPTEAEWEYACRAGTHTAFAGDLDELGWYAGNSGQKPIDCEASMAGSTIRLVAAIVQHHCKPHPVGLKKPNAWGLYDMHGNVWEWCSDAHAPYPNRPQTDPIGPRATNPRWRVMRGGQFADIPNTCPSANRGYFRPKDSIDTFGFRVVEEIDGAGSTVNKTQCDRSFLPATDGCVSVRDVR